MESNANLTELMSEVLGPEATIQRIELIDMLSPPKRNATMMEKYLKGVGSISKQESNLDAVSSHAAERFSRLFGINRGELFELLDQYELSSLPEVPIRSLSIPLEPGVNGAWAPNGYGKTFAIRNILQKLQAASGSSNTMRFENFVRSCNLKNNFDNYENKLIINGWQSDRQGSWRAIEESSNLSREKNKLVPFRELNFSLSSGKIVSIRVDYGADCDYQGFTIIVHQMDPTPINNSQEFESVKVPLWLCLKSNIDDSKNIFSISSDDYDADGEEIDYDYLDFREKLLELILNLAIDYVEIPRLSYKAGFFEEISAEFKKYLSIVLSDFESDNGPIAEYGQLYLSSLVHEVKNQNTEARPPDGLIISLRRDIELAISELEDSVIDYHNDLIQEYYLNSFDYQPLMSNVPDGWSDQDSQYVKEILHRLDEFRKQLSSFDNQLAQWVHFNANFLPANLESKMVFTTLKRNIVHEIEEMAEDISTILSQMSVETELPEPFAESISAVLESISRISEWVTPDSLAAIVSSTTEKISQIENMLNSNLRVKTPWSIRVKLLNWMIEPNSNVFAFEYEGGGSEGGEFRATWDTLSFGQKSNFILQTILILEEGINQNEPKRPLQRCLIIDEPEAGKAEAWVSQLIEDLQQHHLRLKSRQRSSVLILSHRGVVLDSISEDGSYALMHAPSFQKEVED